MTGLTGLGLYSIMCVIYLFAHPLVRRKAFRFFWISHQVDFNNHNTLRFPYA